MIGPTTYRLQWRRNLAKRWQAAVSILLAVVLLTSLVPAGLSKETTPIVTGHSSFYNGDKFDPCLASIVGIMRLRVMWFNHQVLVERYNGDGAYIYATEYGAPDPTDENKAVLVSSGIFYDFVDPNGVKWHVDEAFWDENTTELVQVNTGPGVGVNVNPQYVAKRWYTWIVAVGKPVRDKYPGTVHPHDWYNFVTILNTCKFRKDNLNNSAPTDIFHPDGMGTDTGHMKDDPDHHHEMYSVSLWVGDAPRIAPVGIETPYKLAGEAGVKLEGESDPSKGDEFNNP